MFVRNNENDNLNETIEEDTRIEDRDQLLFVRIELRG